MLPVFGSRRRINELQARIAELEEPSDSCSQEEICAAAFEQEDRIYVATLQAWATTSTAVNITFGFGASATVAALVYFGTMSRTVLLSDRFPPSELPLAQRCVVAVWMIALPAFIGGAVGCARVIRRFKIEMPSGQALIDIANETPMTRAELIRLRESSAKEAREQLEKAAGIRYRSLGRALGGLIISAAVALCGIAALDAIQIFMPLSSMATGKDRPTNTTPKPLPPLPKPPKTTTVNLGENYGPKPSASKPTAKR